MLKAFLEGDARAFNELYDLHTPAVYQFALRLAGGREWDAEEIVQECWMRAAMRMDHFEWRSTFRTWLMGFAVNCARELSSRDRSGDRDAGLRYSSPDDHVPPVPADAIDLEGAVASLPEEFRWVIVMHDVEGFTHAEIAVALSISEGTSKSRLSRARQRLRAMLKTGENQ